MIVHARFNGPPGSGNGGYSAGLFATEASKATEDGGTEVTLRRPPPLDTPLSVVDGQVRAPDGAVVAELAPAGTIDVAVLPIEYAQAVDASRRYPGFTAHPFPTCYVCGPERLDGLRIFAGRIEDGTTAAPWTVPADVSPATVSAALDCPGGWSVIESGRPYVLGRIAVHLNRMPVPGDECVVRGALAGVEGRKALVHSTLYGPDGAELARARATWVAISQTSTG
ncbi:hypothetical protein [Phytohabitans rumicis]|uniref:Thioesterase domain-containing protein n=1 Tax=Phytohabitans rumicis TaxID=1076125 RepID=A0A6V8L0C4_9ACTN|nr:hypothetical protein [Phytohabitans rumicis]GFJ88428.1 hypothetical protein Prum_020700 [Phytohabitans rumicis]